MALTPEQTDRILAAIRAKVRDSSCSLCKQNNWSISDGFSPLSIQKGIHSIAVGGPVLPVVAMTCNNCGHTVLLNLVVLGLQDAFSETFAPVA